MVGKLTGRVGLFNQATIVARIPFPLWEKDMETYERSELVEVG
jgi:hypothetical protein